MKTGNGGLSLLQTPFPLITVLLTAATSVAAVPHENGAQDSGESVDDLATRGNGGSLPITLFDLVILSKKWEPWA